MTDKVLYAQDGAIVTITLNMPESRNPLTDTDVVEAIVDSLDRMNADGSVRVGILTGAGSAFSSGGNVKRMHEEAERRAKAPVLTPKYYKFGIQRIPMAFERLDVPMIAAVNGAAIGAGLDLTTMCDLRIAGESAKFAESFVKVGIVPGDGGAWLLPESSDFPKPAKWPSPATCWTPTRRWRAAWCRAWCRTRN